MKCPNPWCEGPLSIHHTDQYSDYYCLDGCGHEVRVTWKNKEDSPKYKEAAEPLAPPAPKIKKKPKHGRDR